jgi:hypothetical protein
MKFSKDTEEVLSFLDYTSGNNLRKREDMGALLETGATYGQEELISNIIFTGTYLWNVSSSIRRAGQGAEGLEKLHAEFRRSGEELREYIKLVSEKADKEINERFSEVYLPMTAGAFRNLIDLAHDLAELKNIQITLKNRPNDKA